MNAKKQYRLSADDLAVVLALVRAGNLAGAGDKLGMDASTVFRSVGRIERGLGQRLFTRSRSGYAPLELSLSLVAHAEQLETHLERARSAVESLPDSVSGTVRITSTDTILHGLIAPTLRSLGTRHPLLTYELHTGNELTSLTRRDADIAARATKRPPQHLVGKHVGSIRMALFAAARPGPVGQAAPAPPDAAWIAPDDALPDHPSVVWRRRHFPRVCVRYRVGSILTVMEMVASGLGVGVLPLFLTRHRPDLIQLTDVIDECQTELWLLTHPESRHLRRVSTVFRHLSETLSLS